MTICIMFQNLVGGPSVITVFCTVRLVQPIRCSYTCYVILMSYMQLIKPMYSFETLLILLIVVLNSIVIHFHFLDLINTDSLKLCVSLI